MNLLQAVDVLCGTPRVGWLQRGVQAAETVCGHVVLTVLVAADVARRVGADVGRAVAAAAVHDLAEAFLGHPAPEARRRAGWEEAEEEVFGREFPHLLELYREYRRGDGQAGRIAAFADKLATLIRACGYRRLGYPTGDLVEALRERLAAFQEFRDVLEDYLRLYC